MSNRGPIENRASSASPLIPDAGKNRPSGELAQIPRNLLFRFRIPCHRVEGIDAKRAFELPEKYRLTSLGRLEGRAEFADWRCGWNDSGLFFTVAIEGKSQLPWCRPTQLLESDSLQLWIDTRDTHNVHRATRYCHWCLVLPTGPTGREPVSCRMLKINRAREDSPTINRGQPSAFGQVTRSGYRMSVHVPANLLNGWQPGEQSTLGFFAASVDREFGWQTMGTGPELPIAENPSLWCTLTLL